MTTNTAIENPSVRSPQQVVALDCLTLSEALQSHAIPLENHAFIRKFTDAIGIAEYTLTTAYIKARRRGPGPDLNIAYGWSNGFTSEEEARHAAGADARVWRSGRATGLWGVSHPEHKIGHRGGGKSRPPVREYGTCSTCFTRYAANGTCLCD